MGNLLDEATGTVPGTPHRVNLGAGQKVAPIGNAVVPNVAAPKRNAVKVQPVATTSIINRSDVIPVVVPRNNLRFEQAAESRKEGIIARTMPLSLQSRGSSNIRDEIERPIASPKPESQVAKAADLSGLTERKTIPAGKSLNFGIVDIERNSEE